MLKIYFRDGRDDPLDDVGAVKQLMELFAIIARRDYKQTVKELVTRFDENMSILLQPDMDSHVIFSVYFNINFF